MSDHEIIPAIMPQSLDDLADTVEQVRTVVSTVQIDIMDGDFVPEKTWPFLENSFDEEYLNDRGLPYWEEIDYEFDLMVKNPEANQAFWCGLGPTRMIYHVEALEDPEIAFGALQGYRDLIEVGISFRNDYPIQDIEPLLGYVDFVQCMGIEKIGYQGSKHDPRVYDGLAYFQKEHPSLLCSVDGSVNTETIVSLRDAGAKRFVVGSAVFGSGEPAENIAELRSLLQ